MSSESELPIAPDRDPDEVSLFWILDVMRRERRTLMAVTAVGILLALALALARRPTYTSTFSFVPQTSQDASRAGLAGVAGQLGISLGGIAGQSQSPQFYADLLTTRALLAPVVAEPLVIGSRPIRRVSLPEFLGVDADSPALATEETLRILRRKVIAVSVAARTTGVVTVNVRTQSAEVSRIVAERLLRRANEFNLLSRQSQAGAERQFVERRLSTARTALRLAEDALQGFLQRNRRTDGSPELTFQEERLRREVALQQQLTSALVQQYEDARLREIRDTPVITVIEQPVTAAAPDPRGRALILVAGAVLSSMVAALFVLARETLLRRRHSAVPAAVLAVGRDAPRDRHAQ